MQTRPGCSAAQTTQLGLDLIAFGGKLRISAKRFLDLYTPKESCTGKLMERSLSAEGLEVARVEGLEYNRYAEGLQNQSNYRRSSNKWQGKGVTYSANLTSSFDGGQDGNCFFKDKAGIYFPGGDTIISAGVIGG
ncbi:hypothetical protein AFLA_013217 [Aspergillus flavus NRRL3357]|nr:hypothetical protein AFLA_013217 [Aspergillus flavus NRRL3357]